MPNKMLIDASHPEETRVVVVHGSRIEEFDFESQDKKQLKGNIYLARVTRVEPSLQAAFVEYGGNRHGFLAFSEIHPDYYQIPVADRQALLRADAEEAEADDEDHDGDERGRGRRRRGGGRDRARGGKDARRNASGARGAEPSDTEAAEAGSTHEDLGTAEAPEDGTAAVAEAGDSTQADGSATDSASPEDEGASGASLAASVDADVISEDYPHDDKPADFDAGNGGFEDAGDHAHDEGEIESVGAEDALEEVHARRRPVRRQYKIQEVIKRRQILLVQVVKEERGNKGAAITTYLSLAGRYSVLMPNTARGGGISRKITNAVDRKRLKEVVQDLEVPQGMGVILRTAGESRTKAEIKRDYEYLMRLWETVRTLTLQSTAPALVYEEGSLIKRSVRDLYNKDIEEILVSGEDSYREAKDFMRMLMPSHAKVVQPFRDSVPIFVKHGVEAQLDRMLQPQVTLKSGGYIIINQTEALVAIDVNSGRSTREHSIEETALHTNLEAAEEVARQLRLRDLAGLIVIDFIDMEENRNNRTVEKRLKDHLKNDRARIQLGRISHFGLMEMSRQRIRASVLESTTKPCPHCGGTGHVRSDSSVALLVVRAIEEFLMKDSRSHITVRTPTLTAMYVLNHKRTSLTEMERRFGVAITVEADDAVGSQHYAIVRGEIAEKPATFSPQAAIVPPEPEDEDDEIVVEAEEDTIVEEAGTAEDRPQAARPPQSEGDRKRRKRRRRRGGRDREPQAGADARQASDMVATEAADGDDDDDAAPVAVARAEAETSTEDDRKRRRRGRRGGKRSRGEAGPAEDVAEAAAGESHADDTGSAVEADGGADAPEPAQPVEPVEVVAAEAPAEADAAPKKRRAPSRKKPAAEAVTDDGASSAEVAEKPAKRPSRRKTAKAEPVANGASADESVAAEPAETPVDAAEDVAIAEATPPEAAGETSGKDAPAEVVAPTPAPVEDPDRPKKSGWWQRRGFF